VPTYYLDSDARLYYYSFTDAAIAMAYNALSKSDQARFVVYEMYEPLWKLLTPEAQGGSAQEELRTHLQRRKEERSFLGEDPSSIGWMTRRETLERKEGSE
jgi:hypothetical protein